MIHRKKNGVSDTRRCFGRINWVLSCVLGFLVSGSRKRMEKSDSFCEEGGLCEPVNCQQIRSREMESVGVNGTTALPNGQVGRFRWLGADPHCPSSTGSGR